ncbi:MAG: hypothetical protein EU539_08295 [Promethearchaeota archaeon]|nr:MAG: hypothetical protein EU539_08295 [Candidatus Lokiarchaeota archaeon]
MAKKKKEVCPYCGKSFSYLSRHKCKVKERLEGAADDKSEAERRIERIEETKKNLSRNLKKDEKAILNIINREKELYFDELIELTNKKREDVEEILDVLSLQSKIKITRELIESAWTKRISAIEEFDEVEVKDMKINKKKKDFIWEMFSYQPCFICPYAVDKCNETNPGKLNPHHCPWLTEWINISLEGKEYQVNFDEIEDNFEE